MGRQIVSGDGLRELARATRDAQTHLRWVDIDLSRRLASVDRSGWNWGEMDGPWGAAHSRLGHTDSVLDSTQMRLEWRASLAHELNRPAPSQVILQVRRVRDRLTHIMETVHVESRQMSVQKAQVSALMRKLVGDIARKIVDAGRRNPWAPTLGLAVLPGLFASPKLMGLVSLAAGLGEGRRGIIIPPIRFPRPPWHVPPIWLVIVLPFALPNRPWPQPPIWAILMGIEGLWLSVQRYVSPLDDFSERLRNWLAGHGWKTNAELRTEELEQERKLAEERRREEEAKKRKEGNQEGVAAPQPVTLDPAIKPEDYSATDGCAQYAQKRRPGLGSTGGTGGAADYIDKYRDTIVRVSDQDTDLRNKIAVGYAVVWPREHPWTKGTPGWEYGHVAIVEEVGTDYVIVSQAGVPASLSRMRRSKEGLKSLHLIP